MKIETNDWCFRTLKKLKFVARPDSPSPMAAKPTVGLGSLKRLRSPEKSRSLPAEKR
jgi:hypothetical protein